MKGLKPLLVCVWILFLGVEARSSHLVGGDISYKYLVKNKYEVTFKFYRDCRASTLNNPDFKLYCPANSKSAIINAKRIAIVDISKTCDTSRYKCSQSNTGISSVMPIYEVHIYTAIIDFDSNFSAFKNECLLEIGAGQCCRSAGLTTGGANENFWVKTSLNLCKGSGNSSPVFSFKPDFTGACNQATTLCFNAIDTIDGDSISYWYAKPFTNETKTITRGSVFFDTMPLSVYWPAGYDKSKGPRPTANPPIGIWLNAESGILTFTPINSSENAVIAITAVEWRKNAKGIYEIISESVRDIQYSVLNIPGIIPPTITASQPAVTCKDETVNIALKTNDQVFVPPPPAKQLAPDTTNITWNWGLSGGKLIIDSSNARLKSASFTWKPSSDSGLKSRVVVFAVTDNACPLKSTNYVSVKIQFGRNYNISHKIIKLNANRYLLEGFPDSSINKLLSHQWTLYNTRYSKPSNIYGTIEQITGKPFQNILNIYRNGTYIVGYEVRNAGLCTKTFFDTIIIAGLKPEVYLNNNYDSGFCDYTTLALKPKLIGGKEPFSYKWQMGNGIFTYSQIRVNSAGIVKLVVTDANGDSGTTSINLKILNNAKVNAGNDTIVCPDSKVPLNALIINKGIIANTQWIFNGNSISISNKLTVQQPGAYIFKVLNKSGCEVSDTVEIRNFIPSSLKFNDVKSCQYIGLLSQQVFVKAPIKFKDNLLNWYWVNQPQIPGLAELSEFIYDRDTTQFVDLVLKIDSSILSLNARNISFKIGALYTDSNACVTSDTLSVYLDKSPILKVLKFNDTICKNESLNIENNAISDTSITWEKINNGANSKWPQPGILKSLKFDSRYFENKQANYLVGVKSVNGLCTVNDSLKIIVNPIVIPEFQVIQTHDSIYIDDLSRNSKGRQWQINGNTFTQKRIGFLTSSINKKSGKLSVFNENCTSDTMFVFSDLVSVNTISNIINFYPNPSNDFLIIKTNGALPLKFEIYNAVGQVKLNGTSNQKLVQLDVSDLIDGIYYLKIFNSTQLFTTKFEVKHP